ncbi:Oxidoreductase [Hyphomicrobiales bacterium]|nr:Oxidoreductase [Hyphomicrobiales bacterium]CAH1669458.1 Oxidoreductase [Hyphomicrobiales bacterium]
MAPLPQLVTVAPTIAAIYKHYEAREQWEGRTLSISTLADPCLRKLWYDFHWVSPGEVLTGQKIRLFATGNIEEDRFIEELRAIGCEVQDKDPATGRQITVTAVGGHVKGKLDAEVLGLPEAPKTIHVAEMKSHNDKSFRKLLKEGVAKSKPDHFGQFQMYMHLRHRDRAIYLAVNKNTDELYAERVNYDSEYCLRLIAKAERIVRADEPLMRLHEDPDSKAAFACGWCKHKPHCHEKAWPRVNCRTCLYSTPEIVGERGVWTCGRWDRPLTHEEQQAGCAAHLFIPALVPGEQVDSSEGEEWVEYRLADGSVWRDGGGQEEERAA